MTTAAVVRPATRSAHTRRRRFGSDRPTGAWRANHGKRGPPLNGRSGGSRGRRPAPQVDNGTHRLLTVPCERAVRPSGPTRCGVFIGRQDGSWCSRRRHRTVGREAKAPPMDVQVIEVAEGRVAGVDRHLSGYINAVIRPQVSLARTRRTSRGTVVQNGQLLFQIDPREFRRSSTSGTGRCSRQGGVGEAQRRRPLHAAGGEGAVSQQGSTTRCGNQANLAAVDGAGRAGRAQSRLDQGDVADHRRVGIAIAQIGDLWSNRRCTPFRGSIRSKSSPARSLPARRACGRGESLARPTPRRRPLPAPGVRQRRRPQVDRARHHAPSSALPPTTCSARRLRQGAGRRRDCRARW